MTAASAAFAAQLLAAHRREALPLLMGIVNITPDSFSDGGRCFVPCDALAHALTLKGEGADILDLGAESTRPGFTSVSAEEEWQRLCPVVTVLAEKGHVLSIDTMKSAVAHKALCAGVCLVNDIWGFQSDPMMAPVVAEHGAMAVLMHNRHDVNPALDLWTEWRCFFDQSLEIAYHAGLSQWQLVLDPGIGFGKTHEQSRQAVQMLGRLRAEYDIPVLLGLSRKSLFGHFLGRGVSGRLPATLSANLYGVAQGAAIIRVHDVRAHHDALRVGQLLGE